MTSQAAQSCLAGDMQAVGRRWKALPYTLCWIKFTCELYRVFYQIHVDVTANLQLYRLNIILT